MKPSASLSTLAAKRPSPRKPDAGRRRGRIWLNGRELGGPSSRFAHLAASYD